MNGAKLLYRFVYMYVMDSLRYLCYIDSDAKNVQQNHQSHV